MEAATDPARRARYNQLCQRFWLFGYSPHKIVALGACTGHVFTMEELHDVRRTNRFERHAMGSQKFLHTFYDFAPTIEPAAPADRETLIELYGSHGESRFKV